MSEAAYDLLAVGRPSVDVMFSGLEGWPVLGRDVEATAMGMCAGTSFNTPAAANRLGLRVGYVALIGNDPWSDVVRAEFEAESLPTDLLLTLDRPSSIVSVALNHESDRGFVTWIGGEDDDDERLARFALEIVSTVSAGHLHAYAGEEPELTRVARERGMTVSLDATSGPWWEAEAPLDDLLGGCDLLFANEAEAIAMTGEPDVGRALTALARRCPAVVIKRGADGAIGRTRDRTFEAPAEPAEVVDTTGAGDCFNAGFLAGWLEGLAFEEALVLGNVCGAGAVGAFGGYRGCPTRDELLATARTRGIGWPAEARRRT